MHAPRAVRATDRRVRVAWLWEPREIYPETYDFVLKEGADRFDEVWSFDLRFRDELRSLAEDDPSGRNYPKFRFVSCSLSFVSPGDRNARAVASERRATAPASLICSQKMSMAGHRVRHAVAAAVTDTEVAAEDQADTATAAMSQPLAGIVDVFGRRKGAVEMPAGDKMPAYAPYKFHVVVENARVDALFSEQLVDTLSMGCVPLYLGCSKAALAALTDLDVEDGIIFLDGDWDGDGDEDGDDAVLRIKELYDMGELSDESYYRRRAAIYHNFAVAHIYMRPWEQATRDVLDEYFW